MGANSYKKDYFVYKGVTYGVGTKVRLNKSVHLKYYNTDKTKDKLYTFICSFDDGYNLFRSEGSGNPEEWWMCGQIQLYNYEEEIEEIVSPVYTKPIPWPQKATEDMLSGRVYADIFGGVLIYLVIMAVGTIFYNRLLIWICATALFIIWLLNQYRT